MHKVIEAAKSLLSDGSNVEYDRAILEMAARLLKVPEEGLPVLSEIIADSPFFTYRGQEVEVVAIPDLMNREAFGLCDDGTGKRMFIPLTSLEIAPVTA